MVPVYYSAKLIFLFVVMMTIGYVHSLPTTSPWDERLKPSDERQKPSDERLKPSDERRKPSDERLEPSDERRKPSDERLKPSDERLKPLDESLKPSDEPRTREDADVLGNLTSSQEACRPLIVLSDTSRDGCQPLLDLDTRSSLTLTCQSCRPIRVALAARDTLDDDFILLVVQNNENRTIIRQNCLSNSETCDTKEIADRSVGKE
ncbi:hypothetical protein ACOMHN_052983 [Nucella lapillus]